MSSALPTKTKVLYLKNAATTAVDLDLASPTSTFALREEALPAELQDGEILVKVLYLSNDPAQRSYIQKGSDPERTYAKPVREGDVMAAYAISRVIASTVPAIKEGTLVNGPIGWREFAVVKAAEVLPLKTIPGVSPSVFLGALGGAGLTAYFGLVDVLKFEKGQSIIVSGAAGAVGNIVVQYAKHILGASKVVAIAGSDEKNEWLRTLGADVALNYKDPDFDQKLEAATDGFVDAYFDNVGGHILDVSLTRVKRFGKIAACGAISSYNGGGTTLQHWGEIIQNRLTVTGFIVLDFRPRFPEAVGALASAVQSGKITIENAETLVEVNGLEGVPEVWGKLFVGGNQGKLVTKIKEEGTKL